MATTQVNVTASLSANGKNTANGTMTWTAPSLPADAVVSDIIITGMWSWSGKGSITSLTINGISVSGNVDFSVSVGTSATSTALTCINNNKNATGDHFNWTDLIATYTYTVPGSDTLYLKVNGVWTEVSSAYLKVNGTWVEQDITTLFDSNANYVKGN